MPGRGLAMVEDEVGNMRTTCLSPLRGFAGDLPLTPTVETVGYCRVSLWDKEGVEA